MNSFFAFATLLLMVNLQAYSQQRVNQSLQGFTALKAASGVDVYLKQGDAESVEIEANEEAFKYIVAEVDSDQILVIKMDNTPKRWFSKMGPVKVYVSFTHLNQIQLSGGSDLLGQGMFIFEKLRLGSSGGSDLKMNLRADELEVNSSGGADVELAGSATYFKGVSSGGSDIKTQELETEVAEISSSGASDIRIKVIRALKATASGASDIIYYGNPEKVEVSTSGASDISKR